MDLGMLSLTIIRKFDALNHGSGIWPKRITISLSMKNSGKPHHF